MKNTFEGLSESGKVRMLIEPYIIGKCGLDVGFGGTPIIPNSITVDMEAPYTARGNYPQHLKGDARKLLWFKDNVLDYVYSSHLLEDFEDPHPIVVEWIRVIKLGGLLILNLPNEKKYREFCDKNNGNYNGAHKNMSMSLEWMKKFFQSYFPGRLSLIEGKEIENDYTFYIILRKEK